MSFVQASDGKFYENPVMWGDGWYAHFDGDEPEVVVPRQRNTSIQSGRSRAAKLMRGAGLQVKDLRYYGNMSRFFPPSMNNAEAFYYQFKLVAPIPVPNKFDTVVDEPGHVWDNNIYGFYSDVSSLDLAQAVLGLDITPLISRALLAKVIYAKEGGVRAEVSKKLYAQVPWLRELEIDRYAEQLKDKPHSVRIEWRVA